MVYEINTDPEPEQPDVISRLLALAEETALFNQPVSGEVCYRVAGDLSLFSHRMEAP